MQTTSSLYDMCNERGVSQQGYVIKLLGDSACNYIIYFYSHIYNQTQIVSCQMIRMSYLIAR